MSVSPLHIFADASSGICHVECPAAESGRSAMQGVVAHAMLGVSDPLQGFELHASVLGMLPLRRAAHRSRHGCYRSLHSGLVARATPRRWGAGAELGTHHDTSDVPNVASYDGEGFLVHLNVSRAAGVVVNLR
mmetsp:Transcript_55844/g.64130  ORF Transcript_55844/g.64130 Transcript_55844/m.64130 type:complete len:133 (+) Transcript_55844:55-453(+)